ncbi:MAG: sulfite exporter TauE/SafE family protein [Candidatus Sumerlaeota bacterium]|nr:sulfite exporter TauE/SafE family protein [Candidatus Sumerlaeota bacterium]
MSVFHVFLAALASLMIGLSKTAVPGMALLFVPLFAQVFGPKPSVGIVLPLLIVGDIFAVYHFKRMAEWSHLLRLMPYVLIGMLPGIYFLNTIGSGVFKPFLGFLILAMLVLDYLRRRYNWTHIPHQWWFIAGTGFLAGFTTYIANMAGSVMALYLLSHDMPKRAFIGTTAWFFCMVNLIKFVLFRSQGMITSSTVKFNLYMAPFVIAGALLGVWLFPKIPQKLFNRLVLGLSAAAALHLIFF